MTSPNKTFLITGVSTGLGRALAEAALQDGHRVVGTLRKEAHCAEFERLKPGHAHGVLLDVKDTARIEPTVLRIEKEMGGIDVLVNNAGYGVEGTLEEASMEVLREQFEVNLFGAVALMKAVIPHMRQRRSGRILNITSMGGMLTMPGISFYHGTKFALEGISESFGKEVRDFNVFVTAVAPGSFRTDWAGRSMDRVPRTVADYDGVFTPLRERRQAYSGKQAGDPTKAARAMLGIIDLPEPPAHLLLGSDAVRMVRDKLNAAQESLALWETVSLSTDYDI